MYITGRGGLQVCEMLRIPQRLDNLITDGGKVVSHTRRTLSTPKNRFLSLLLTSVRE
jgi:hypothetical protein